MKWIFYCYGNAAQQTHPASPLVLTPKMSSPQMFQPLKVFLSFSLTLLALWLGLSPGYPSLSNRKGAHPASWLSSKPPQKHFKPSHPLRGRAREAGPGPASCHLRTHTEHSQVQTILGMCRLERFIYLCIHIRGSFQVPVIWTHKNIKFLWLKVTRRMPTIKLRKIFMINGRQRFIILL